MAQLGKKVLLFDADLSLANLDILFGVRCEHNLADVLEGKKELREVMIDVRPGLKILPSSSGVLRLERLAATQLMRLAASLQELALEFDTLLIDTGAGLTDTVLFFSSSADGVLVVTTPDPTAVTDAYALLKILNTDYNVQSAVVIVNQARSAAEGDAVFERLRTVCEKYLHIQLTPAGGILRDPLLEDAVRERKPLLLTYPDSQSGRQFQTLAARFDRLFYGTEKGLSDDFWTRLVARQFGTAVAPGDDRPATPA
jgi:flagellar biosynthesis protein FlhG